MIKELEIQNNKEEKNLSEKVEEAHEFIEAIKDGTIKTKQLKIPRKAKVRKGKLRKGWIGVLKIDENGNISAEKTKISGSAYSLKDGSYHATDGKEILFWQGKFPILIQTAWKKNPLNVRLKEGEMNETYGDPYIKAKLLKDVIKVKGRSGGFLIWILIAIGGYIGYTILFGGGL